MSKKIRLVTLILVSVILIPSLLVAENPYCPTPNSFPDYCGAHNQGCCGESGSYSCCSNYICMEGYNCHCRNDDVAGWDCSPAGGGFTTTTTTSGGTTTTVSGGTTTTVSEYGCEGSDEYPESCPYCDNCDDCILHWQADDSCGWCADDNTCRYGNSGGPDEGSCTNWIWESCSGLVTTTTTSSGDTSTTTISGGVTTTTSGVSGCVGTNTLDCDRWDGDEDPCVNNACCGWNSNTDDCFQIICEAFPENQCSGCPGCTWQDPCGNGELDTGEECDPNKDCSSYDRSEGCGALCKGTGHYAGCGYESCTYTEEPPYPCLSRIGECGSTDSSCGGLFTGDECDPDNDGDEDGTCNENCECIHIVQPSSPNPEPNIPFTQSFHSDAFDQGGLAIITGQLIIVQQISDDEEIEIIVQSPGSLVTRAISLNPEVRITNFVQEV